ncbi:conserved membrane hypothetical protein [Candidatus Terasakiella magnetica]|nr:conserved membrane hypothetical protein [Candidatus Terasakiella magnetica]
MFLPTWNSLSPEKKKIILAAILTVFASYAILIYVSASALFANKTHADMNHAARMSQTASEPGKTAPDSLPTEGTFSTVTVGTYIDNIDTFSIRDSSWSANFYVWFSWTGSKSLDPGGKLVIVDGTINKKELMEEYHGDGDGGPHYQKYRISAKLLKFFDTSRVPIEGHMLNIYLEDGARDATKLRYIADKTSNISSRANIHGYTITRHSNVVKPHTYRSSYGDPRLSVDDKKTYTQYIVGVEIKRSNMGVYGKIFLSLFAALALALSNFFVKPSDVGPRFSLPTAAYFGAVANSYVANSILPPSGSFGLVDYVAAFGMGTIFLTIALSLLSNFIFVKKDDKALALVMDRVMFVTVGLCCIAANIIIPWSALG